MESHGEDSEDGDQWRERRTKRRAEQQSVQLEEAAPEILFGRPIPGRPYRFHFDLIYDYEYELRWGVVPVNQIDKAIQLIAGDEFDKLGLLSAFAIPFPPPNTSVCREFIRTYNRGRQVGLVRGREYHLTKKRIRKALGLSPGEEQLRQVRQKRIEDWFPARYEKGHRCFTQDCTRKEWEPMFQIINAHFLARRRVRDVTGRLALTVKSAVDGEILYDWSELIFESLHSEIIFLRSHLLMDDHNRYVVTWIGPILTWLFCYKHMLPLQYEYEDFAVEDKARAERELAKTHEELERLRNAVEEVRTELTNVGALFKPRLLQPTICRQKTLILALEGLLCRLGKKSSQFQEERKRGWPVLGGNFTWFIPRSGLKIFMEQVTQFFTVIVWSTRLERNNKFILKSLEEGGHLPLGFAEGSTGHVFHQSHCCKLAESGDKNMCWVKDLQILYEWNLCTRDVLLLDDSPLQNLTNHPYLAIHPHAFSPESISPEHDDFLNGKLLPWLLQWSSSPISTSDYVREQPLDVPLLDPFTAIRQLKEKGMDLSDVIWRTVTMSDRLRLVTEFNEKLKQHMANEVGTSQYVASPSRSFATCSEENSSDSDYRIPKIVPDVEPINSASAPPNEPPGTRGKGRSNPGSNPPSTRGKGRGKGRGRGRKSHPRPKVVKDNMPVI
ncbi:hypothetical protein R1sor_022170 [Riccia sorocarpa]|uniref:FCP1 homology domain-containing protein n=1 Tax=Riccia sorocarpa TaxID=122646 RepID=A0ABD3GLA8_9MARC